MNEQQCAQDILSGVGGSKNIKSVVHCMTRLRFHLYDEKLAQTDIIKGIDGVVTVIQSGGQYQVVVGTQVAKVYEALAKLTDVNREKDSAQEATEKNSLFNRFIDLISSIFTPTLGVLAASGMIKGLVAVLTTFHVAEQNSGTLIILMATGDALFQSLPIFLGYNAAKKFKANIFIVMAIAAAMVYPAITGLAPLAVANNEQFPVLYTLFKGSVIEAPIRITFFGIPVIMMSYASSVIPIILSAYVSAKVEVFFQKIIPDVVKMFLVPFFSLLVMVPLTFLVIGPISTWAGDFLGALTSSLYNFSPIITGMFMGGFWQIFVMFGLHWGLIPIKLLNLGTQGFDNVISLGLGCSFAQIGAVLAVYFLTKDKKAKTLSIPAFISGIFGITEPAIYGVTLPLKYPFYASCVAGSVAGGILGYCKTAAYSSGGLGIFAFPSYLSPSQGVDTGFIGALVATVVAFILGFVLTFLLSKQRQKKVLQ